MLTFLEAASYGIDKSSKKTLKVKDLLGQFQIFCEHEHDDTDDESE